MARRKKSNLSRSTRQAMQVKERRKIETPEQKAARNEKAREKGRDSRAAEDDETRAARRRLQARRRKTRLQNIRDTERRRRINELLKSIEQSDPSQRHIKNTKEDNKQCSLKGSIRKFIDGYNELKKIEDAEKQILEGNKLLQQLKKKLVNPVDAKEGTENSSRENSDLLQLDDILEVEIRVTGESIYGEETLVGG